MIQINAKAGGIPWSVDKMPFGEDTMVVGLSSQKAKHGKMMLGLSATTNKEFT